MPCATDELKECFTLSFFSRRFGRTETYRLYLSIKAKALKEGLKLRFWGKVLGRSGDYLIAQAENPEPPPRDKKMEGAEGANKYAFWACKYAGADWVKLPDTTPEAIVVARQIKRFFTGDLDAPARRGARSPLSLDGENQLARATSLWGL